MRQGRSVNAHELVRYYKSWELQLLLQLSRMLAGDRGGSRSIGNTKGAVRDSVVNSQALSAAGRSCTCSLRNVRERCLVHPGARRA